MVLKYKQNQKKKVKNIYIESSKFHKISLKERIKIFNKSKNERKGELKESFSSEDILNGEHKRTSSVSEIFSRNIPIRRSVPLSMRRDEKKIIVKSTDSLNEEDLNLHLEESQNKSFESTISGDSKKPKIERNEFERTPLRKSLTRSSIQKVAKDLILPLKSIKNMSKAVFTQRSSRYSFCDAEKQFDMEYFSKIPDKLKSTIEGFFDIIRYFRRRN